MEGNQIERSLATYCCDKKAATVNIIEMLNATFICLVLFLHHGSYSNHLLPLHYAVSLYIQKLAVGGFFFCQGLRWPVQDWGNQSHHL
jgi:hypothetical protein